MATKTPGGRGVETLNSLTVVEEVEAEEGTEGEEALNVGEETAAAAPKVGIKEMEDAVVIAGSMHRIYLLGLNLLNMIPHFQRIISRSTVGPCSLVVSRRLLSFIT